MWWLIWIVTIVVVIATKVSTGRIVIQMRFALTDLQKRLAKARRDERVAQENLDRNTRYVADLKEHADLQREANKKLGETIASLEEAVERRRKEAEEAAERMQKLRAVGGKAKLPA